MIEDLLRSMMMPRWARSCYNCARGCKGPGIGPGMGLSIGQDMGNDCPVWKPDEGLYIPTEFELEALNQKRGE